MFDAPAFAALIRQKRGEMGWTQADLAAKALGSIDRKSDISRLETGKKAPQEDTVQKLCLHLEISEAEMAPIRQSRVSAKQLDQIPSLSREELQNLAARFQIDNAFDAPDAELRRILTLKAEEYRALKAEVDGIEDGLKRLSNLKFAAQDAIARVDLNEVEELLSRVQEVELEEAAKTAELRAENALLRGKVDQAYRLLSAAADSFAAIDPLEPARRRIQGAHKAFPALYNHGLRYGGDGLEKAASLIANLLNDDLKARDSQLWAAGQNNLGIALQYQGTRTAGPEGATLLAEAVTAYRAALEVTTRADHPLDWAMTQNNLGAALQQQGIRTAGPEGATLLAEAVTAYRSALKVRTRADHPLDWAATQNNLAIALRNQGTRTAGPEGAALLAEAVTAYRAALEVTTRADHPLDWALTQNNLGAALSDQGTRTAGPEGATLLAEAVTALRAALEVRTRAENPVDWALTQENIALALKARAAHDSASDPRADLTAALQAVEGALEVYDPEHMSYYHNEAIALRDQIRAALAALG